MSGAFEIKVEIVGLKRLENQLRSLEKALQIIDPVISKHATKFADDIRNKPYPPMLPNQKYKRTGLLGRRFRAKHAGMPLGSHAVENRVPYAIWVAKRGWQNKAYHLGRWWTLENEAEKTIPTLQRELSTALEQELDRQ